MDFVCKTSDNTLTLLGFDNLDVAKRIRIYTAVEGVMAISSLPDDKVTSIGRTFDHITLPECKAAILHFLDAKGKDILHFSRIDGCYYSTEIAVKDFNEAIHLAMQERLSESQLSVLII